MLILKRMRQRIQDMKTVSRLIAGADEQANLLGDVEPGAEHYVLSALELPDGSAQRVFDRFGADKAGFQTAIKQQYSDALKSVGVCHSATEAEPVENTKVFKSSKPSGVAVMKQLYALKKNDKDRPLLGVHVISVVASMELGVVARAFKSMGVAPGVLSQAVSDELGSL